MLRILVLTLITRSKCMDITIVQRVLQRKLLQRIIVVGIQDLRFRIRIQAQVFVMKGNLKLHKLVQK
jgi:hypothetical protein